MKDSEYQVWLTIRDGDGSMVPYEQVGGASTYELAKELKIAAQKSGYTAEIIEGVRAI